MRCLVCGSAFGTEPLLEHLPAADRVAYDPERGRLWLVCPACRRWSLVPIEDRWEALEALEKATRDRGKTLSSTDRIALVQVGPLEVVRVGGATRTEEAWWRYGRELLSRRNSYGRVSVTAAVATGAVVAGGWATGAFGLFGAWWISSYAPDAIRSGARWYRFGSDAWRGRTRCSSCGHEFRRLAFRARSELVLVPGTDGEVEVVGPCPACGTMREGGFRPGSEASGLMLRRILAHQHFSGADGAEVRRATRLIEEVGEPARLAPLLLRDGRRLGDLQRTGALALEIASNEAGELRKLEMEVAELEAVWRREEELASIIDGELTPLPPLEAIRRRLRGFGGDG